MWHRRSSRSGPHQVNIGRQVGQAFGLVVLRQHGLSGSRTACRRGTEYLEAFRHGEIEVRRVPYRDYLHAGLAELLSHAREAVRDDPDSVAAVGGRREQHVRRIALQACQDPRFSAVTAWVRLAVLECGSQREPAHVLDVRDDPPVVTFGEDLQRWESVRGVRSTDQRDRRACTLPAIGQ